MSPCATFCNYLAPRCGFIFETDLRLPLADSYTTGRLEVRIYGGNEDLKEALRDLTSIDDLRPADIQLRFAR
jgi:hypothetical protein